MTTRLVRLSRRTGSMFVANMLSLNLIAGCSNGKKDSCKSKIIISHTLTKETMDNSVSGVVSIKNNKSSISS